MKWNYGFLNADAMSFSRIGGATMNMPAANFSQNGLASIFGIKVDDDIQAPADNAHKRTAIIAGTISGIAFLAFLVGLGWYVACKKNHDEEQLFEKDDDPIIPREVVQPVELQAASLSELPVQDGPLPLRER